jgi:hypothetical protein
VGDYWYAGGGIGLGPAVADYVREPYPEPAMSAHPDTLDCCPRKKAVNDLWDLAVSLGWEVKVTHARGCFPNGTTGAPGTVQDSLAVRMRQGPQRAVAVYAGTDHWSWGTIARWDLEHPRTPDRLDSVTSLVDFLEYTALWGWHSLE